MESKVNYTLVGLFVLILGAAIIIIPLWLSSNLSNKRYQIYAVHMFESVSGLSVSAPVKYNGVDVGNVRSIQLNVRNPQEVDLLLNINEGTPITTVTTATLEVQGLTGVANIALKGGNENALPLVAAPNQPYPVIKYAPSLLMRLTETINHISKQFDKIMSPENQIAFSHSLANINRITTTLANNSAQINSSIQSLNVALKNAAAASQQFPIVIQNIHTSAEQFDEVMQQWTYISQILNGTTLPKINSVVDNLQTFTKSVKQNPSILLRGQAPPPPGPGE